MPVVLPREPLVAGIRVVRMPAWVGPDPKTHGTYWHMPRSASRREDGTLTVHVWCGPLFHHVIAARLSDSPPEDLRCGTCVGRRAGYDRVDGLVFQPRNHFALPKRCPGESDPETNHRTCFACGRRCNAARGWWASGIAMHRPDPALAERFRPCPRHGWKDVRAEGTTLVCKTFQGGHLGTCGFNCAVLR